MVSKNFKTELDDVFKKFDVFAKASQYREREKDRISNATRASINNSVSCRKACRRLSSKSGNILGFGLTASKLRRRNHWPAKLLARFRQPLRSPVSELLHQMPPESDGQLTPSQTLSDLDQYRYQLRSTKMVKFVDNLSTLLRSTSHLIYRLNHFITIRHFKRAIF